MQTIGNPNHGYHALTPDGNILCGNTDVLYQTATTVDGEPTCEACKRLLAQAVIVPDAVYLATVYPDLTPKQAFERYQASQNIPGFA